MQSAYGINRFDSSGGHARPLRYWRVRVDDGRAIGEARLRRNIQIDPAWAGEKSCLGRRLTQELVRKRRHRDPSTQRYQMVADAAR